MNNQTFLVAKNVYRTRIKGAGFWVMIIGPLLIPLISIVVGLLVGSSSAPKLAVVNNPALVQVLKAEKSVDATLSEVTNENTARTQLNDGKIDGYLTTNNGKYTIMTSNKTVSKFTQAAYQSALTQVNVLAAAQKLGLTNDQLKALLTPASLTMSVISSDNKTSTGGDARLGATMGISIAVAIVMMIILMLYVTITAQEVANEKSSRIMETLLAATSSNTQYYGKILGIIALALTQIVIYIIGFGIASFFLKNNSTLSMVTSLFTGVDANFIIYTVLMLIVSVLGYLFLSSIVASLVNEQSQVQQATQPIAFFSMIGYVAAVAGAAAPNNLVLRVLSFIPFISPTLMTSRLASQYSSPTEAWIALGLQVIATIAVAKAGEKIYARNVLSYSSEKIFAQFFRNLRGKGDSVTKTVNSDNHAGETYLQRRLRIIKEQPWRLLLVAIIIIVLIVYRFFIRK